VRHKQYPFPGNPAEGGPHFPDATEVMQVVTEVLCYGTAIVADREQGV
jgi:hypothetical protein